MVSSSILPDPHRPVRKSYRAGTHRLIEPEETLARVRPFLSHMGITRVANVTGLDRIGVHVVQVCRPNSRSLAVSQGKGLGLAAAKASAVMESIEAYHADHITLPVKYARYADLSCSHRVVDVTALNRPKASAYHPELPLLWIEGWDLLRDEPVWLPFEMVDANFTFPRPAGSGCFAATSNGLASGNHLLEAISHGISEVVERDATTLWGLAGTEAQDRTRIDLQTVQDAACNDVLDKFARAGIVVGVWETTSDVGVPSFLCKIRESTKRTLGHVDTPGYGCHPMRSIALFRALTEAAQTRLTIIAGSRDDLVRSGYEQSENPLMSSPDRPWFEYQGPLRSFSHSPTWETETFDEDVRWLLERLRAAGIQRVVVVDLSKPEFGLPVVRVVIPGLEMALIHPDFFALGQRARTLLRSRA
jgi:ribosomal protein S12 methylthiotransferase accessory factor